MRATTLILLLLGLGTTAGAQTMIPIPGFGSTFSSASLTRGLYFQAANDFTIVGLRVPDESQHGLQNVAVYRPVAKPPAYSATAQTPPIFVKFGEPSQNIIPCAVSFKTGEWCGILGACGDATTMRSSYATPSGPFLSQVLGVPTTLYRFITQSNIVVTQGVFPYSSSDSAQIGRVEVYVASASLTGSGAGAPGTTIDFVLSAPADGGLPYQMGSSLGNGPIPIDTRRLELSLDALLTLSVTGVLPAVFQNYAGVLDAQGAAKAALAIPNQPALKGVRIYTAFVTLLAAAPSGLASISNSFLFTIQ